MISSQILEPAVLGTEAKPPPPGVIDLGDVGSCPQQPTLVIGIVDDSGSVTAPGGADPISNRYGELGLALRAVARACRCRQERAAVLHFDSPAGDTAVLPLTRAGFVGLSQGLRAPIDGCGTSDLLPALRRASELAGDYPDHEVVLIVFSDFALSDRDPSAVIRELRDFPGVVYACVLGRDRDALQGIDRQIAVDHTSQPGAVAQALLAALTHHRRGESDNSSPRRGRFHNALAALPLPPRLTRLTSGPGGRTGRHAGRLPDRHGHRTRSPDGAQ